MDWYFHHQPWISNMKITAGARNKISKIYGLKTDVTTIQIT